MGKLRPGSATGYLPRQPQGPGLSPPLSAWTVPQQQPGAWDREPQEGGIEDGFPHFTEGGKLRHREAKSFAPGHPAGRWQTQALNREPYSSALSSPHAGAGRGRRLCRRALGQHPPSCRTWMVLRAHAFCSSGRKCFILMKGSLPYRELAPGPRPGQDLADRALGQPQHVVAEHPLPNVVFQAAAPVFTWKAVCRVQLLSSAPATVAPARPPLRLKAPGQAPGPGAGVAGAVGAWCHRRLGGTLADRPLPP